MRLFVSINFNSQIKKLLCGCISSLRAVSASGNFTREENLHLTLAFIGETDKVREAKEALSVVNASPFNLNFGETGVFRRGSGDLHWVGVEKTTELLGLQKQVADSLKKHGFMLENREFAPHITLGREVFLRNSFNPRKIDELMQVSEISLMRSERSEGRLLYTELYNKKLL
ncbi:MAG: RNA 2',3'-cyclic phosphodiesterase [Firmicutes bacterium HGW-Firmicutes-21]|nr:MAG: RNA 2',3'-cyclic phosphodiesterase [Firmicutes bacterium HGW-Firmicutes-21]